MKNRRGGQLVIAFAFLNVFCLLFGLSCAVGVVAGAVFDCLWLATVSMIAISRLNSVDSELNAF